MAKPPTGPDPAPAVVDPPTRVDELQRDKLAFECAKLEIEVEQLRRHSRMSQLPLLASAIGSLGAVVGLLVSADAQINQLHFQRSQFARQDKVEQRQAFQQASEMATDAKGGAERQISGIYQLGPFWDHDQFELGTGATLASLLVSPNSGRGISFVRCAAAQVIGSAITRTLPPAAEMTDDDRKEDDRQRRLKQMLYGDRNGEQGVVAKLNHLLSHESQGNLLQNAKVGSSQRTPDDNINCTSAVGATVEAIRKNWENLRSTNLQATDLSYAELYEADLHDAALMNTRFARANLRCANLSGANLAGFDAADQPMVELANVTSLTGAGSAAFRQYAVAHGAIEIADGDWIKWRQKDFRSADAPSSLSAPEVALARQSASLCGPFWSRSTQSADRSGNP
jgi:hypothetical protein